MLGGDINPNPIQILVNYWELRPTTMVARLDELLRHGITHVASFVPWQAVESDITHTLPRFLQALAERKMTVALILTPEVGIHYTNSGLPKDILSKPENVAAHHQGGPVTVNLPPNAFALPSLASQEFTKRYHNFLSRIDGVIADLGKTQPHALEGITTVLTGSFWKYYRSPSASTQQSFGGPAGDYSRGLGVTYRQMVDQYYTQPEFQEPTPMSANRWKTRSCEDINRKWFYQHCEDVFRIRSTQFVRRKALPIQVEQFELYTPEADAGYSFSQILQMIAGGNGDFARLSSIVDDNATRASLVGDSRAAPFIHWTGFGSFRSLSDSEKQFLILKSLLLMGGQGGGLLIDEGEWFSFSETFRSRAEGLARLMSHGDLKLRTRALYLAPHLWSGTGTLWEEVRLKLGANVRLVSSIDLALMDKTCQILFVDPNHVFTQETLKKLSAWVASGRLLVMPRSPLYTDAAKRELERMLVNGKRMDLNLGVSYRLHQLPEGKVVIYELPEAAGGRGEALSAWQTFLSSVLSVANVLPYCSVSDGRLKIIPLERKRGGLGLFILNESPRSVAADLLFASEVGVSDLASAFTGESAQRSSSAVPSSRFALEVPPCGILPLAIDGMGIEAEERRVAAMTSQLMEKHAMEAASNELPGFNSQEDIQAKWN